MENVTTLDLISFGSNLVSITLALVAMILARLATKESQVNYQQTKDVLAQIDTRAAVIETTVQKSQEQLLNTVTKIIDETVIPRKSTTGESLFAALLNDPAQREKIADNFLAFMREKQTQKTSP